MFVKEFLSMLNAVPLRLKGIKYAYEIGSGKKKQRVYQLSEPVRYRLGFMVGMTHFVALESDFVDGIRRTFATPCTRDGVNYLKNVIPSSVVTGSCADSVRAMGYEVV